MRIYLVILLIIANSTCILAFHPTHMSVVTLEINPESLEVLSTIRIFQDDMNYLISSLYHEELFHSPDTFDFNNNTKKIENYFTDNFKLIANNKIQEPKFVSKETTELYFTLNYKYKLPTLPKTLSIENTLLIDLFSDQTNLVICSFLNKEKGLTFNKNIQNQSIDLNNL